MDHVPVIPIQLIMQRLGSMGQRVTVLVKGTALDRQTLTPEGGDCGLKTRPTIDGHQRRRPQTTGIRMVKEPSPSGRALPCHVLNRSEDLLSIPSQIQGHQYRDDGSFLVGPCLDHHGVQWQMSATLALPIPCPPSQPHLDLIQNWDYLCFPQWPIRTFLLSSCQAK